MANTATKYVQIYSVGPGGSSASQLVTGHLYTANFTQSTSGTNPPNNAIFKSAKLMYNLSSYGWPWTDSDESTAYVYWVGLGDGTYTVAGNRLTNTRRDAIAVADRPGKNVDHQVSILNTS